MKLIHKQSSQCLRSEVDLFSVPLRQTAVDGSQWVEHSPVSTITWSSPIEFIMSGSGEDYMDLNNTLLEVKACIKNNERLSSGCSSCSCTNKQTLHTLFNQIYVSLNDVNVSSPTTTYPYRAYIETHLNYGTDAKINASRSDVLYR